MYLIVPTQPTCVRAWVAAALAVIEAGNEAYNVVIDVDDPTKFGAADNAAITLVNEFLTDRDQNPVVTVANTIFPESLYRQHGAPKFYDEYHKVFGKLTDSKRWGRYFERMTRHQDGEGKTYNPLQEMIDKLKRQEKAGVRYKAAYELAVYDPLHDGRSLYGGQCLSFLSFKLHPERGLMLIAMYRNHTYITRCLGNLIGLGRLQAFVAKEAGLSVGPLTCVSTHAEVDTGDGKEPKQRWKLTEAKKLVERAQDVLNAGAAAAVTA